MINQYRQVLKLFVLFFLSCFLIQQTTQAQNINFSFANSQITSNGTDSFYEADVMIDTDQDFKMGMGQLYIDYNSLAFGENIKTSKNLQIEYPDTAILGQKYVNIVNFYQVRITDSNNSKFSISWMQNINANIITTNVTKGSSNLLFHIKIKYNTATTQAQDIIFDTRKDFTRLTYTAATTPMSGDGDRLIHDSFDSSGSAFTTTWNGTSNGEWHSEGNWQNGSTPNPNNKIVLSSEANVKASSDIDIFALSLKSGATLTVNGQINSDTPIKFVSKENNESTLIANSITGTVTYVHDGLKANLWYLISPPVTGQSIREFVLDPRNDIRMNEASTPKKYAVGYYSTNGWIYYNENDLAEGSTLTFEAGMCYAISRKSSGAVSFIGTTPNEDVTRSVAPSKWQGIGNPYTSFLPVNQKGGKNFIAENISEFHPSAAAVYVWDSEQKRYIAYTITDAMNRQIKPGQAFIVKGKNGSKGFKFNKTHRKTKGNANQRNRNAMIPSIQLFAKANDRLINAHVKYYESATNNLDPGYDVVIYGKSNFDIYTKLVEGHQDQKFTVQSLPLGEYENTIIPIGLKGKKGDEITFHAELNNLPENIHVYLEDRMLETFIPIASKEDTYNILHDGKETGRFFLHTTSRVLSNHDFNTLDQSITISTTGNSQLKVQGTYDGVASLTIFSMKGQEVYRTSLSSDRNQVDASGLSAGVYMVRLHVDNKIHNQKIVLGY